MKNDDQKKEVNLVCEPGIGFSQRDKNIKTQEEKGFFDFVVIKNTGENTPENLDNMKLLTDLKNIIAKQLPKMPKEYIVRLVFDKHHENMIIIQRPSNKVLGGTCYRPNPEKHFIEIAFLAISSLEQVKGFGTRLMNKLKDHCKKDGYQYFLTYADNNAIGYFKKQGFHKNLKMPMEQWKDYIKDYDGGTLMEAEIDPKIDYSNLSEILKQQKKCIEKYSKKFLNIKRKYSFNDFETELKKSGIDLNSLKKKNKENEENIEITKELFNCIPGMKESGWTYEDYITQCKNEKSDNISFLEQCRIIINKLKNEPHSWPYREPVDATVVQDYYQKIKEPMDLRTLEKGVESGQYKNKTAFVKDLKKIFNNARTYNKSGTIYSKYATVLENFIEEDVKKLKEC